ncbi:fluoride efflux transporter CrcB [Ammoniphilus sp. CFH 90114]|uniref:fluoride efflux transporter CrcB n=1 Tax=Ammoniphilus sp. CFH 90114 TaxID=2493665 RepID=UPI00100DC4F4|nr:fluoride efflux transporter CrcB [Ammoniphilus sp. CFH 90114]RXT08959.1 fluoride efflux transporter CrcB [Ammoniphilus sp. CFH 90114]
MSLISLTIGGAAGAIARYLVGLLIMRKFLHPPIPIAMMLCNLLGSAGLGILFGLYLEDFPVNVYNNLTYLGLGIGFFGAFTTFSTFSMESVELLRHQHYKKAVFYVLVSLLGSVMIFYMGFYLFKS